VLKKSVNCGFVAWKIKKSLIEPMKDKRNEEVQGPTFVRTPKGTSHC